MAKILSLFTKLAVCIFAMLNITLIFKLHVMPLTKHLLTSQLHALSEEKETCQPDNPNCR